MADPTLFFVLNGLVNGNEGEPATTTDERSMEDGWYYLLDDENPNGYGPHTSRDVAERFSKGRWLIYIPEEGHWGINYHGSDPEEAKRVYLEWAERTDLPEGAVITEAVD